MSLLDSLPIDRNFIRESLDDVNIDVLDEEEIVMQVSIIFCIILLVIITYMFSQQKKFRPRKMLCFYTDNKQFVFE
jgi:hypothetical protein